MPILTGVTRKQMNQAEGARAPREPLPDGWYDVRIINTAMKNSSAGNSMIEWTLEVVEGDHTGRRIWENTVLLPQSMWTVRRMVEAATGEVLPDNEDDINTEDLHGKVLRVLVAVETGNNGNPRNNVKDIQAAKRSSSAHPSNGGSSSSGGAKRAPLKAVQEEPEF